MDEHITIRTYRPGDPSQVCYFQYKLYEKQYRFNGLYEQEMLSGMAELYCDAEGSQLWLAELDGELVGDIAVINRGEGRAQLRWFGVAMSLQGQGLGTRLLETALAFCCEKGYTKLMLGTLDILKPARHLYAKFGFHPTESELFSDWDPSRVMYHETWEREPDAR